MVYVYILACWQNFFKWIHLSSHQPIRFHSWYFPMNVQLPHTSYHVHIGSICSVVHMKQTISCYLESFIDGLHIIMSEYSSYKTNFTQTFSGFSVGFCINEEKLPVTNLSSENNSPTFRLNAPIVIRAKVKRSEQTLLFIAMHY